MCGQAEYVIVNRCCVESKVWIECIVRLYIQLYCRAVITDLGLIKIGH